MWFRKQGNQQKELAARDNTQSRWQFIYFWRRKNKTQIAPTEISSSTTDAQSKLGAEAKFRSEESVTEEILQLLDSTDPVDSDIPSTAAPREETLAKSEADLPNTLSRTLSNTESNTEQNSSKPAMRTTKFVSLLTFIATLGRIKIHPLFLAILVFSSLILWMVSGFFIPHRDETPAPSITEIQQSSGGVSSVQIIQARARGYQQILTLQAQSAADRSISLAAQVPGLVQSISVRDGQRVKKGDEICRLETAARDVQLQDARSKEKASKFDYAAAFALYQKGHVTLSYLNIAEANYNAARGLREIRELELARTGIYAPFNGVIEEVAVEIGNFLNIGGTCAILIDKDPLVFIAHIPEDQINLFHVGMSGTAMLTTGESVSGQIRYIAPTPNQVTRSFRMEMQAANPGGELHTGISTKLQLTADEVTATLLPQVALILNDNGVLGVRVIRRNIVQFIPVTVLSDSPEGMWVTGLRAVENVITIGQHYVNDGQRIEAR